MTCDSGRLRNGAKGLANAASHHRATDASHEARGIDFRDGPAVEWLSDRCDLAHQLVEESKRD